MAEIKWNREATGVDRMVEVMEQLGHTNVTVDVTGRYSRAECEHGCTAVLMDGVHSYGTGMDWCAGRPIKKRLRS